jgi:hypothetical protein
MEERLGRPDEVELLDELELSLPPPPLLVRASSSRRQLSSRCWSVCLVTNMTLWFTSFLLLFLILV